MDHGVRRLAREARLEAERALGIGHAKDARQLDDLLARACLLRDGLRIEVDWTGELGAGTDGRLGRDRTKILLAHGLAPAIRRSTVAHELGHFDLHDERQGMRALRYPTDEGFSYDTGYSARSLTERQAETYADEFLCPSDRVRTAIEAGGPKMAAIAATMGLEPLLVLRQARHALLPQDRADAAEGRPRPTLDAEQRRALARRDRALLIEGASGSGRSTTLVAKAAALLDAGVPASAIALLAHSELAAMRLRSDLARTHPRSAATMWIDTQTALVLEIVACHSVRVGISRDFAVLDPTGLVALLARHVDRLPADSRSRLPAITAAIANGRRSGAPGSQATRARLAPAEMIASVETILADLKARTARLDRSDLFANGLEIVAGRQDVARRLAKLYRHVLVDDYQDLRRDCIEVLRCLQAAGAEMVFAGGPAPSIRLFDGACPDALATFDGDFHGERLRLGGDHRRAGPPGGAAVPARGIEARPRVQTYVDACGPTVRDGAAALARAIRAAASAGAALGDQAILVATNPQAKSLLRRLADLDLPVLHLGEFHLRPEVRDLCDVASLWDDDAADVRSALDRLAVGTRYGASRSDAARLVDHALRHSHPVARSLQDAARVTGLTARGRAGLGRLGAELRDLSMKESGWRTLATWVFDRSAFLETPTEAKPVAAALRRLAIHHVLGVCQELDERGERNGRALVARLRNAGSVDAMGNISGIDLEACGIDAVRLMTVHAAQGREFDVVHLPVGPDSKLGDGEVLSLVAASRARRRLHILRTDRVCGLGWTEALRDLAGQPIRRTTARADPRASLRA